MKWGLPMLRHCVFALALCLSTPAMAQEQMSGSGDPMWDFSGSRDMETAIAEAKRYLPRVLALLDSLNAKGAGAIVALKAALPMAGPRTGGSEYIWVGKIV
jgi:hypothetical protein